MKLRFNNCTRKLFLCEINYFTDFLKIIVSFFVVVNSEYYSVKIRKLVSNPIKDEEPLQFSTFSIITLYMKSFSLVIFRKIFK